mmetsp:Transcript_24075/g.27779  ORF Transcript_24075/g.27779 Transcript_24075/m.27779 type:complete len:177 (-) Transcript_24075:16-546(-)
MKFFPENWDFVNTVDLESDEYTASMITEDIDNNEVLAKFECIKRKYNIEKLKRIQNFFMYFLRKSLEIYYSEYNLLKSVTKVLLIPTCSRKDSFKLIVNAIDPLELLSESFRGTILDCTEGVNKKEWRECTKSAKEWFRVYICDFIVPHHDSNKVFLPFICPRYEVKLRLKNSVKS